MTYSSILTLFLLFSTLIYGQRPDLMGKVTDTEKQMSSYDQDPEAEAVILYERGDNYFTQRIKGYGSGIYLVQQIYRKTKIFKKEAFGLASVTIPIYGTEKIENLKALTHNGSITHEVLPSDIYHNKINGFKSEYVFTFSNVREGSIIEYQYDKITPYYSKLRGWYFQTTIPKLHSEFNAKIPGHLKYNRAFFGEHKLDVNSAQLEKHCFKTSFLRTDCETIKYVMKAVPAFVEEPEFMLSRYNYISRIEFELAEVDYNQYGKIDISTTWEELDEDFSKEEGIGGQLVKNGFFRRKLPKELLEGGSQLSRAKKIFNFVKDYYTWDKTYGGYRFNDVREAFKQKKGNVAEINMTLINLLNEAGIRANLMLSSTRSNGLPKKNHPSISDFNYFLARIVMDGKIFLLDASDKSIPFGMVPFRALNRYGRVMDFNRKSYWSEIKPTTDNMRQIRGQVVFHPEKEVIQGTLQISNFGYPAIELGQELQEIAEEDYLNAIENKLNNNTILTSYKFDKERSGDVKTFQRFNIESRLSVQNDKLYFNPFMINLFEKNPFSLDERKYPVDFGYPREYKYSINITIPEGYEVQELPKPQAVKLGDQMVVFKFHHQAGGNQVALTFDLKLNSTHILAEDYPGLKEVFKHVTDVQNNSLVVLNKL